MKIKLIAFGIAKDILKSSSSELEISTDAKIADLKNQLVTSYPEFEKLASLRFAINEDYQTDQYELKENDEVVIIPPVSGG